jgi:hypothetical protein
VIGFTPTPVSQTLPGFGETRRAAREHWNRFWSTGGAIDLSHSRDPRWRELERRIVLSQYLTAIQCSGRFPPQETGLTFNSWEGKFHLEMHWWHAAHFALWGRLPLLERSLGYYSAILPRARETASRQGYAGARRPKMTSPSGAESPSSIGPFLVWQQPHPIYYAELVRRERGDRATLERFRDVVFETAEFMASFAWWDETGQRYVLGPPLEGAQEIFPKDRTVNTVFELAYWRWGLETAQRWREQLGLAREPRWQRVLDRLSPLPVRDGCAARPEDGRAHNALESCAVRKNLVLDERLLEEAVRLSGERTYSGVVQRALGDYVRRIRARRILALGGSGLWEGSLTEMRRDRPTRRARTARGPR